MNLFVILVFAILYINVLVYPFVFIMSWIVGEFATMVACAIAFTLSYWLLSKGKFVR